MALPAQLPSPATPLVGVTTTGIFCRPGCSGRPRPDHVERFGSAHEALFAGYRPCLRCRPLEQHRGDLTDAQLRRGIELHPILAAARRARRARTGSGAVALRMLRTPLGPMLAGATDAGICLLEFTDRPMLPSQLEVLRRRLRRPLSAGRHPHLDRLETQLAEYFAGDRVAFDVPVVISGSPFQERVWEVLRTIPPGGTLSYEELAVLAGRPRADRAAGTANGANRLALLIPCHRVIRKGGEIGNYGGGRWRKAWLLAHEARHAGTDAALVRPGRDEPARRGASQPALA